MPCKQRRGGRVQVRCPSHPPPDHIQQRLRLGDLRRVVCCLGRFQHIDRVFNQFLSHVLTSSYPPDPSGKIPRYPRPHRHASKKTRVQVDCPWPAPPRHGLTWRDGLTCRAPGPGRCWVWRACWPTYSPRPRAPRNPKTETSPGSSAGPGSSMGGATRRHDSAYRAIRNSSSIRSA